MVKILWSVAVTLSVLAALVHAERVPQIHREHVGGIVFTGADSTLTTTLDRDRYELYQVVDYGRFTDGGKTFMRAEIPKYWVSVGPQWESLNLQHCNSIDDRVWSCPRSAAAHSPSCDLDNVYGGCHINAYRNLADGFVMTNDTSDGDVIVATNAKTYRVANGKWQDLSVPSSGVAIMSIPLGTTVIVGTKFVPGRRTDIQQLYVRDVVPDVSVNYNQRKHESQESCDTTVAKLTAEVAKLKQELANREAVIEKLSPSRRG
ncbi:hypothetical protein AAVH_08411 [Aphelenchoides avenae]|nr:hypothetical protein AAVH_08411 [Aphelenchus avenae]